MDLPDKARLLQRARSGRAAWAGAHRPPREAVREGQESVWDFPRPPALQPSSARARVVFAGRTVADSCSTVRVVETASAPVVAFPTRDVDLTLLSLNGRMSVCEWKGAAVYYDLTAQDRVSRDAAYTYPDPFDDLAEGYAAIAGLIAFYPGRVDEAWLDDERVRPQPGGYYAGWVTSRLAGPIKGERGTEGW